MIGIIKCFLGDGERVITFRERKPDNQIKGSGRAGIMVV